MANTNAPNGFVPVRRQDGAAWTGNQTSLAIAYNYGTAIYRGDPVLQLNTGFVARGAAGNTAGTLIGIFMGCRYISSANNNPIYSNYWPGSGNLGTANVEAFVVTDPSVVFEVQALAGPVTFADIGQNADFDLGTGNTLSGISGATLTGLGTTNTLPFRVIGFAQGVGPGTDIATAYNKVEVIWNDQFFKQSQTGL